MTDSRHRWHPRVRLRSFAYAFAGLVYMVRHEANATIHLVATLGAVGLGLGLHISVADWRWLVVAVALVWIGEGINTAIESLCNLVSPEPHEAVRIAKDVAAGAVLVAAIGAVLIGGLTLFPYFHGA